MKSAETVIVARLADHYEKHLDPSEHDPLDVAARDFMKFKRDAPKLWQHLHDDSGCIGSSCGGRSLVCRSSTSLPMNWIEWADDATARAGGVEPAFA